VHQIADFPRCIEVGDRTSASEIGGSYVIALHVVSVNNLVINEGIRQKEHYTYQIVHGINQIGIDAGALLAQPLIPRRSLSKVTRRSGISCTRSVSRRVTPDRVLEFYDISPSG
jgi:hypothetical protein